MATSILLKFLTLKWNISRTIWRVEVGDGSFFLHLSHSSFELNFFFDRRFPLTRGIDSLSFKLIVNHRPIKFGLKWEQVVLRNLARIPYFKKAHFKKTRNFEKVSIYKRLLSLNEFHFLIHSLMLV